MTTPETREIATRLIEALLKNEKFIVHVGGAGTPTVEQSAEAVAEAFEIVHAKVVSVASKR